MKLNFHFYRNYLILILIFSFSNASSTHKILFLEYADSIFPIGMRFPGGLNFLSYNGNTGKIKLETELKTHIKSTIQLNDSAQGNPIISIKEPSRKEYVLITRINSNRQYKLIVFNEKKVLREYISSEEPLMCYRLGILSLNAKDFIISYKKPEESIIEKLTLNEETNSYYTVQKVSYFTRNNEGMISCFKYLNTNVISCFENIMENDGGGKLQILNRDENDLDNVFNIVNNNLINNTYTRFTKAIYYKENYGIYCFDNHDMNGRDYYYGCVILSIDIATGKINEKLSEINIDNYCVLNHCYYRFDNYDVVKVQENKLGLVCLDDKNNNLVKFAIVDIENYQISKILRSEYIFKNENNRDSLFYLKLKINSNQFLLMLTNKNNDQQPYESSIKSYRPNFKKLTPFEKIKEVKDTVIDWCKEYYILLYILFGLSVLLIIFIFLLKLQSKTNIQIKNNDDKYLELVNQNKK